MDWSAVLIIINLILLEGLLSVDNAAVLAVMVSHLPEGQRQKALKYGIIGAYVFRGICLVIASWLIQVIWLKIAGGLYLLYLAIKGLKEQSEEEATVKKKSGLFKTFWGTVFMVEIMDIAFSIDNVFAAVAMDDRLWVVCVGVFIGILTMRFVAGKFVILMSKYPSLAKSAYIVILLLGIKLIISGALHYFDNSFAHYLEKIIESHIFDLVFSLVMMLIFFVPLIRRPKKEGDNHWFI